MSFYTDDDLRDFVSYVKDYMSLQKKEDVSQDDFNAVEELLRVIVTMRYNAMVFESFISGNSKRSYILCKNLSELPLHLNDEGLVSQLIVKWRLNRNK